MSRKTTVRTPVVAFASGAAPQTSGDVVRRKGVIFRSGIYPEKSYAMSPDDLRRQVAEFVPVPIDLGHPSSASPLDGKFGHLEAVELSADGSTLFGTAAFPRWFDDLLGDARRKVSASWDRSTKRLKSLSLVTHPQIGDAELQAAFACACGGHPDPSPTPSPTPKEVVRMATQREKDIAALQAMSDDDYESLVPGEDEEVDVDDDEEEIEEESYLQMDGTSNFGEDPEKVALLARLEALEDERRVERAANFAAAEVAANRILSHEQANAEAVMYQALADDAILGDTVHFSAGTKVVKGTREAMVRAAYGQRKPHTLTTPAAFARSGVRTLDNDDGPETDEAYAKRVLAKYNGRNKINGPAS